MNAQHVRKGRAARRERQLSSLHQREAELLDYNSERWWENCRGEGCRFPEYEHLTEKNQAQFRLDKMRKAELHIDILRRKLHIREGN